MKIPFSINAGLSAMLRLCKLFTLFLLPVSGSVYSQPSNTQPSDNNHNTFLVKNRKGTHIAAFKCTDLIPVSGNTFLKKTGNKHKLVSRSDSALCPSFDSIGTFRFGIAKAFNEPFPPLSILKSNGKTFPKLFAKVFIDSAGIVRSKISSERLASLSTKAPSMWELLDTTGQLIVPPYYQYIGPVNNGLMRVKRKGKWGIIDTKGYTVVSFILDSAGNFGEHYAPARIKNHSALIDPNGNIYSFPFSTSPEPLTKHLLKFKADSLTGLISLNGDTVVQPGFTNIKQVSPTFFSIKKNNKYGLINKKGETLLNPVYDSLEAHIPYDFIRGYKEGTSHFYDTSRDSITLNSSKLSYKLKGVHNGFICIKRKGKYGYIDHLGRNRIAYRYKAIKPITEGYARVRIQGLWGTVDKKGDIVIQPYYKFIGPFRDSLAAVKYQDAWGIIKSNGDIRIPHTLDTVYHHKKGYWILEKDGKKGILTRNGEYAFHPRFDKVKMLSKQFFAAEKNNKWGVVRANGNQIVPYKYQKIAYFKRPGYFVCLKTNNK